MEPIPDKGHVFSPARACYTTPASPSA
jgi:hypothetical protein